MRERIVVGIWLLISGSVSIAFPDVAHAQPSADSQISCDAPEALQHALMTIPAGGRIIVRAGVCTGNFMLSRDLASKAEASIKCRCGRPNWLNLSSPCRVELPRLLAA